jgi:hypothetical protein
VLLEAVKIPMLHLRLIAKQLRKRHNHGKKAILAAMPKPNES